MARRNTRWTDERIAEIRRRWRDGEPKQKIMAEMDLTRGQLAGAMMRCNLLSRVRVGDIWRMPADHPAAVEGHTLFPKSVVDPLRVIENNVTTVLKPGRDSRKLGRVITKGAWAGLPVFSLTLEERATCPATCHRWLDCYGNAMQFAARNRHGPDLERAIASDLHTLDRLHRGGYAVRLHVLGDFYSVGYVRFWARQLALHRRMRIWGYTAWQPDSQIGRLIAAMNEVAWQRFAVRFSTRAPGRDSAITVRDHADAPPGTIVCPAELGKTPSCSTCALCWAPAARDKTIAFIIHGAPAPTAGVRGRRAA